MIIFLPRYRRQARRERQHRAHPHAQPLPQAADLLPSRSNRTRRGLREGRGRRDPLLSAWLCGTRKKRHVCVLICSGPVYCRPCLASPQVDGACVLLLSGQPELKRKHARWAFRCRQLGPWPISWAALSIWSLAVRISMRPGRPRSMPAQASSAVPVERCSMTSCATSSFATLP